MARDRSLDEFLGGTSGEDAGADGEEVDEDAEDTDASEEPSPEETDSDGDAEPDTEPKDEGGAALPPDAEVPAVEVTMAFTEEGAACVACGETVNRRWRDDAGLVCPDCKGW